MPCTTPLKFSVSFFLAVDDSSSSRDERSFFEQAGELDASKAGGEHLGELDASKASGEVNDSCTSRDERRSNLNYAELWCV
jgi:hypothetical protein